MFIITARYNKPFIAQSQKLENETEAGDVAQEIAGEAAAGAAAETSSEACAAEVTEVDDGIAADGANNNK